MTVMRSPSKLRIPAVTAFAVAVFLIPWLSRNVIPLDVCFRLLLPIVWLSVWSLACLGPGKALLSLVFPSRTEIPAVVVLLSGSAVLALLGFFFATAGVLRPITLNVVLCGSSVGGLIVLFKKRASIRFVPEGLISPLSLVMLIPVFLTMAILTTYPVMYDVLHYHLAFPEQWLRAGSFVEFPRESFSYYPSAHGMLYCYALSSIGPWGANAINWWMGLMTVSAAAELGRRLGGPRAAPWAAATLLLTPAVLEVSGFATADLTVAAWTGGALLFLLKGDGSFPDPKRSLNNNFGFSHPSCTASSTFSQSRNSPRSLGYASDLPQSKKPNLQHSRARKPGSYFCVSPKELLGCGFLAGSAAAAKYLAMATVWIPLMLVLVFLGFRERIRLRNLAVGTACLVMGFGFALGPWFVRNVVWTQNPVYPYFQEIFGENSSGLDLGRELERTKDASVSGGQRVLLSAFAVIRRSFFPRLEGGILGSHWLIFLIAAAAFSSPSKMKWPLWIFLLGGCLIWGFMVQYVRFLIPTLVAGAALAGDGMAVLTAELSPLVRRILVLMCVFLLSWNGTVLATPFFSQRLAVVCGQLDEFEFRRNWDSRTDALDFIQRSLPQNAVLLLVGELRSFGLEKKTLVDDPYGQPLLVELAQKCDSAEVLAGKLRDLGITHLLVNRREMPRLAGLRKVPDYWSPAGARERRLLGDFFSHELKPLFEKDGVGVYRLRSQPDGNFSNGASEKDLLGFSKGGSNHLLGSVETEYDRDRESHLWLRFSDRVPRRISRELNSITM